MINIFSKNLFKYIKLTTLSLLDNIKYQKFYIKIFLYTKKYIPIKCNIIQVNNFN